MQPNVIVSQRQRWEPSSASLHRQVRKLERFRLEWLAYQICWVALNRMRWAGFLIVFILCTRMWSSRSGIQFCEFEFAFIAALIIKPHMSHTNCRFALRYGGLSTRTRGSRYYCQATEEPSASVLDLYGWALLVRGLTGWAPLLWAFFLLKPKCAKEAWLGYAHSFGYPAVCNTIINYLSPPLPDVLVLFWVPRKQVQWFTPDDYHIILCYCVEGGTW